MSIILKSKDRNIKKVNTDPALFLLFLFIPIVGILITFIISILKKQYIYVLYLYLLELVYVLLYIILWHAHLYLVIEIVTLIIILLYIYLIILGVFRLNYWTYKKYEEKGYIVDQELNQEEEYFVKKAKEVKKPLWLINF